MSEGYVKLWRKSMESSVFDNPILWKFWCWCLMKATHKKHKVIIDRQEVALMSGQFVFGRRSASGTLGITERQIRTCLTSLKATSRLTIKTTNKYSIITIINWDAYQGNGDSDDQQNDQQNDQPVTSKRPANDHIQECKKQKNVKNKTKTETLLPDWLFKESVDAFIEMRKKLKKPLTDFALKLIISKLSGFRDMGYNPNDILNESVVRGWQSVFEPKEKPTPKQLPQKSLEEQIS